MKAELTLLVTSGINTGEKIVQGAVYACVSATNPLL
jgi:hypothetical protein